MTRRWKILLHSMTFKRDFGSIYVLAKLLERLGCECFISSNTNYKSIPLKLWNPDAVFYVTLGRTESLSKYYPRAKLFLWPGEGGESYSFSDGPIIVQNKNLFDSITKVYLWGNLGKEHILQAITSAGKDNFLFGKLDILESKFKIACNPRIDLIRYSVSRKAHNKPTRIGFVGNFPYINSPKNSPLFVILSNTESPKVFSYEETLFQCKLLKLYCNTIMNLDNSKYEFSLRPYPLEPLNEYYKCELFKSFKIRIDDSLDFSSWINNQDLIIGSTSSTLCQLAIAEKPYINLDRLAERDCRIFQTGLIPEMLLPAATMNSPRSTDEYYNMIENYSSFKLTSPEIRKSLNYLYNTDMDHSGILEVACDIIKTLENNPSVQVPSLGLNIAALIDRINTSYKESRNRSSIHLDYSFFNYYNIKSKAREELGYVIDNILKSPENITCLLNNSLTINPLEL